MPWFAHKKEFWSQEYHHFFGSNGTREQMGKKSRLEIKKYPESYKAYANRGIAKINQLTTNGNLQPSRKETKSACKDLRKAQSMGDSTVGDMIFIYCENKQD